MAALVLGTVRRSLVGTCQPLVRGSHLLQARSFASIPTPSSLDHEITNWLDDEAIIRRTELDSKGLKELCSHVRSALEGGGLRTQLVPEQYRAAYILKLPKLFQIPPGNDKDTLAHMSAGQVLTLFLAKSLSFDAVLKLGKYGDFNGARLIASSEVDMEALKILPVDIRHLYTILDQTYPGAANGAV